MTGMSENNSIGGTGKCGPACEGETLIIEVMGKDVPEGQLFRLFDASNREQQEQLEDQVEMERLDVSALHVWPWKGQPSRNVWLDIDAEEGSPVRIPLFSGVASTPRQPEGQWNRIWPVVPLTLLNDPDPEPGRESDSAVPVRPGFIYVFRSGTLWRELEARNSDAGTLEFCDVRLVDYREPGVPGVKSDQRSVVGKPQPSIWLPVCEMNNSIMGEFQLAFSEVQLSARQLTYLELNDAARQARCQSLSGSEPQVASQHSSSRRLLQGSWCLCPPSLRCGYVNRSLNNDCAGPGSRFMIYPAHMPATCLNKRRGKCRILRQVAIQRKKPGKQPVIGTAPCVELLLFA